MELDESGCLNVLGYLFSLFGLIHSPIWGLCAANMFCRLRSDLFSFDAPLSTSSKFAAVAVLLQHPSFRRPSFSI